jgi:SAM-dependent methyltransferase
MDIEMNYDREPLLIDLDAPSICLPEGLVFPPGKPPKVRKPIRGASPRAVAFYGGIIPDLLGVDGLLAGRIFGWPDALLQSILAGLQTGREKGCVPPEILPELEANGLANSVGKLTKMGHNLGWHAAVCKERGDEHAVRELADKLEIGSDGKVLDVGCGAGQTIFSLQKTTGAKGVGIDCDLNALALGCRIQAHSGEKDVQRICASVEAIPFKDCHFSHVISQVALNYMHQSRALREIHRVLRPGGLMMLFVENIGYDLRCMRRSRSIAPLAKAGYSFVSGVLNNAMGIQISPGNAWAPSRAFASVYRLRIMLHRFGCEVFSAKNTTMYMGMPLGTIVLARKQLSRC